MSMAELLTVVGTIAVVIPLGYGVAKWVISYRRKRVLPIHPPELKTARGSLAPCSFFIKEDYQTDRLSRWKKLADIEIELVDVSFPTATHVYLIPSGCAPRALHNPEVLKNDRRALLVKRQASIRFTKKWEGRELKGFWFRSVKGVPMVYSTAYDNFLKHSSSKYSRP